MSQQAEPRPQDAALATYAGKITKAEAQVDWSRPPEIIWRQIRAYNPAPGAATTLGGVPLKLWRAQPAPGHAGEPGAVLAAGADGIVVGAGGGAVVLTELQLAGGRRLAADAFLAGHPLARGTRLGT